MSLKTNYKNDMFSGKRKYQMTENSDGTISLDDVTNYEQIGDVFSADDINDTNAEVNSIRSDLSDLSQETEQSFTETNNQISDGLNAVKSVKTVSVPSSGWSNSVPYTQTVTVSGIESTDTPIGDLYLGDNPGASTVKNRKKAWSCVDRFTTGTNSVTLYCYEEKPTTTFTMQLKGE